MSEHHPGYRCRSPFPPCPRRAVIAPGKTGVRAAAERGRRRRPEICGEAGTSSTVPPGPGSSVDPSSPPPDPPAEQLQPRGAEPEGPQGSRTGGAPEEGLARETTRDLWRSKGTPDTALDPASPQIPCPRTPFVTHVTHTTASKRAKPEGQGSRTAPGGGLDRGNICGEQGPRARQSPKAPLTQ